ncbi:major facilitator superfamily domain-containing protein [Pterulicium gracile]|uniref:Major facilitator superfamily domain-containing protein n=1 Tax=Pterulicium gracile TaxID=1884261 RepID=A0A5C3QBM9_9AGAR|nr:major facilitator superfamily domain-containing protein [Pterula gracilis]
MPASDATHESRTVVTHHSTTPPQTTILDDTAKRSRLRSVLLVITVTLGMITNLATSTGCSVIVPVIGQDLNVAEGEIQWIVSAYTLACGCLLIPLGRIADLYGSKKMFIIGTLWLAAFTIGCGFAPNIATLNVLRAMAGIGPAAFMPSCIGILASSFPPSRARSAAFAIFASGAPIGGAVGTQLGALLAQKTSITWRSPFFLFAGFAGLCAILGFLVIDADRPLGPEVDRRVDWIGSFLITAGLVCVTFALGEGTVASQGWRTPYVIVLLILGVLLVGVFQFWQLRLEAHPGPGRFSPPPLLKPSLWSRANGKFTVMQMIAFFEWAAFISWFFWVQVYYQEYVGYSPIRTAVRLLPTTISGVICTLFVMVVVAHVDVLVIVLLGTFFTGIAALLFALVDPSAVYWAFGFPSTTLGVFGADFVFTAGTLYIAKIALPEEQSLAGGLFQTLNQLGSAFGLALTTIAHNSARRGPEFTPDILPYRASQWTSFGLAILCKPSLSLASGQALIVALIVAPMLTRPSFHSVFPSTRLSPRRWCRG